MRVETIDMAMAMKRGMAIAASRAAGDIVRFSGAF
jgi:hypothetical protein